MSRQTRHTESEEIWLGSVKFIGEEALLIRRILEATNWSASYMLRYAVRLGLAELGYMGKEIVEQKRGLRG